MVEHADLIDTELLHEPKGIKESSSGEVYVSYVENAVSGPWGGEWRKLKIEDLDLTKQSVTTPTYQNQDAAVTLISTISTETTGSLSNTTTLALATKNDQELFIAVNNLLVRLAKLEDTVSKLKTLTASLSSGLKTLDLFEE